MPVKAVGLVLVSCGLHALWNVLLKRARHKMAFTAVFLLLTPVLFLPMFLFLAGQVGRVSPAGWACVVGAGLLYCAYFLALAAAYADGELSVAYPLARGVGPAFTLVWGLLLLREKLTLPGAAGVALILGATVALLWPRSKPGGVGWSIPGRSAAAALAVAVIYSLYSLTDKVAVGRLHIPPGLYIYLTYLITALLTVPCIARRHGTAALVAEWRANRDGCAAVALLNVLAYLLVLYALSLPGTPVSYVVPLRSVSVLLAVLLGVEVLGEEKRWSKFAAGALMTAGIALVAWKG